MTTPKETLWELDPHTKAKHEILGRYLAAWFPILSTYHSRIVYIDGFSGPGRYKGGETGSPMIALDVAVNHRKSIGGEVGFWFIEEREDRLEHLRQELAAVAVPKHFRVVSESGKEAMWKVDPDGDFRFSDATNPSQLVLFEADTTPTLLDELRREFCAKGQVTGVEVRTFVENKTAYLKKHLTAALKQEEATKVRVEPLKADGKKRRANTYPDDARLTWV